MTTTVPPRAETVAFGPLRIAYDDRLLRPRPWTTAQSAWAAALLPDLPDGPVLELCAGAGHIGLLAVLDGERRLVCVDVNPVACAYIRDNAAAAGLGERVEAREGPMQAVVRPDERFALVIADPPWVRQDAVGRFPEDPVLAIDGGADGLDLAWTCVEVAARHLLAGGSLLLQLGSTEQAATLEERLAGGRTGGGGAGRLAVREVRAWERGVVARLDASATSPYPPSLAAPA